MTRTWNRWAIGTALLAWVGDANAQKPPDSQGTSNTAVIVYTQPPNMFVQQPVNVQVQGNAPTTQPALLPSVTPVVALQPQSAVRIDLVARARLGMTEHELGAYVDSSFRPLIGSAAINDGQRATLRRTPANERTHAFRVVRDEFELRANASFWGIVTGQASATTASQHGYFRVQETEAVLEIPTTMSIGQAPVGAAWYVSAIYYGRMVETHVSSNNRDIIASLGARWSMLRGNVTASLSQMGVTSQTHVLGLNSTGSENLFVHDASELAQVYSRGAAVPILVRYSRVNAAQAAAVSTGTPLRVFVTRVEFPRSNQRSRTAWDVFGGAPDIQFNLRLRNNTELRTLQQCTVDSFICDRRNEQNPVHPGIVVTPANPLVFTFWDVDPVEPDYGGEITIERLPDPGQERAYIGYGIVMHVRTELAE